jgi:transposase
MFTKDSVYLCIMGYNESVIFQKTYGYLDSELRQMRDDMLLSRSYGMRMESTGRILGSRVERALRFMELKLVNLISSSSCLAQSDVKDAAMDSGYAS